VAVRLRSFADGKGILICLSWGRSKTLDRRGQLADFTLLA
jgi:hypothetical protein